MCGIVGLRIKKPELGNRLGSLVTTMLDCLASRGPDSTGIALYRCAERADLLKYSVTGLDEAAIETDSFAEDLESRLAAEVEVQRCGQCAIVVTTAQPGSFCSALGKLALPVRLIGYGRSVEVYKDVGDAAEVCGRYGIPAVSGYQAVGHTRMATESAVTAEHSHPFVVSGDLALVHNGTFSNYATIRRSLSASGVSFDTDNDSEVAARFVAFEMAGGAGLLDALKGTLKVFDGFYTLLVTTASSMAVVRDSFACKPMVVAETEDYVAIASEYAALADLPSIDNADIFEPGPAEVYSWGE